jgi:hypothetical protein
MLNKHIIIIIIIIHNIIKYMIIYKGSYKKINYFLRVKLLLHLTIFILQNKLKFNNILLSYL